VKQEEWYNHACPVCGYLPDMEKIVESAEGKKYLHCALCEYEWVYRRIGCAVCGSEDADSLGFLEEEKKTPYRIDYCEKCMGYIKSMRIPKFQDMGRYDLAVENILTAYLDTWAIQRGYSRP
jgi:FdhE protein